ncbi:MAG: hypothetical protein L5656_10805 [Thermanaeromonas sp.]|nr:hypothetical protein [Thermanaeromonas sp.]
MAKYSVQDFGRGGHLFIYHGGSLLFYHYQREAPGSGRFITDKRVWERRTVLSEDGFWGLILGGALGIWGAYYPRSLSVAWAAWDIGWKREIGLRQEKTPKGRKILE